MLRPTKKAIQSPMSFPVFEKGKVRLVAVGGEIRIKLTPPKIGEKVIPEANQKELEILYKRGHADYIEVAKKAVKAKE